LLFLLIASKSTSFAVVQTAKLLTSFYVFISLIKQFTFCLHNNFPKAWMRSTVVKLHMVTWQDFYRVHHVAVWGWLKKLVSKFPVNARWLWEDLKSL